MSLSLIVWIYQLASHRRVGSLLIVGRLIAIPSRIAHARRKKDVPARIKARESLDEYVMRTVFRGITGSQTARLGTGQTRSGPELSGEEGLDELIMSRGCKHHKEPISRQMQSRLDRPSHRQAHA